MFQKMHTFKSSVTFSSKLYIETVMENITVSEKKKKISLSVKTEMSHLLFQLQLLLRFSKGTYNLALDLLLQSAKNT